MCRACKENNRNGWLWVRFSFHSFILDHLTASLPAVRGNSPDDAAFVGCRDFG